MRLFWQAIRAVAVETLGVVAVVWLLFTSAGWTLQVSTTQGAPSAERAWKWARDTATDLAEVLRPERQSQARDRYVEQRLQHYSSMYRGR